MIAVWGYVVVFTLASNSPEPKPRFLLNIYLNTIYNYLEGVVKMYNLPCYFEIPCLLFWNTSLVKMSKILLFRFATANSLGQLT